MDTVDRRRLLRLLAGAGVAGLAPSLAACANNAAEEPLAPLRVGLLLPLTGHNENIGVDLRAGFELYLATRGGALAGHPVEIRLEDEGDSVESGKAGLEALLADGVHVVAGIADTELLGIARDTVEEKKVPLLALHASATAMPSAVYVWRTGFLADEPGRAVGSYLRRQMKGTIGLIGPENDPVTTEALNGFAKEYGANAGTPVTVAMKAEFDVADFTSSVNTLLAGWPDPDAIFCALPTRALTPFLKALWASGYTGEVYAPGTASEGVALDSLGNESRGIFTAMNYSADLDNSVNHDFSYRYSEEYGRQPSAYAVSARDAAAILEQALGILGDEPISRAAVNKAMTGVGQIVSPRGNWQFNQQRAPQQQWYLRKVDDDGPILSNILIADLATLG